jgi:hypothetical protein
MTLFPRSPQAPEFQELTHLRLTSRRILDARDLTNGIDTAMIDCMHDVTTVMVQPSMERAFRTAYESRAKGRFASNCRG